MTESVILVGASGLAREVIAAGSAEIVGILDDDPVLHGTEIAGIPVVGGVADAAHRAGRLLVCVGSGAARRDIVRRLRRIGVGADRFMTFVAPSARIGRSSRLGPGSILLDAVVVTADASIGRHVVVMPNVTITHDAVLEDFVTLAAGVSLGGAVRIREGAYIGMNASVRQHLVVGADATLGMGAALLSHVPDGETWAGVPARRLERRP
ncbi:NeuD/PglB/VioB family sugar acetyltransferase [Microbacterium flavescens]|uniref:NeuD/PglB/VioB family sugar acetyltransferase n=1 Tax=Microbacterium flavescens TaxID=69366 RepID=UPI001BDE85D2|nr:NeuD/PglB/VioB family sugar acetyltransferase [Microbacterium flavescens]BFF09383.1 acetyltransferase [Microbacterium flavescens]